MNKALKQRFITAYQWNWGCSKKEAEKAWAKMDDEGRKLTIQIFEENAKRVFNDD